MDLIENWLIVVSVSEVNLRPSVFNPVNPHAPSGTHLVLFELGMLFQFLFSSQFSGAIS